MQKNLPTPSGDNRSGRKCPFSTFLLFVGLLTIVMLPGTAHAQDDSVDGVVSPYILSSEKAIQGGGTYRSWGVSTPSLVNPALSAVQSRITAGAAYTALIGTGEAPGLGTLIDVSGTFPAPYGVLGGGLDLAFLPGSLSFEGDGWRSRLRASYAKALYPNLFFGAAATLEVGGSYAFEWGAALDAGIAHRLGNLDFLSDIWWGLSFHGLGKEFQWAESGSYLPEILTPKASFGARFVETENITADLGVDISFPRLSNFRITGGVEATIWRGITAETGLSFDVERISSGAGSGFPFYFSVGYSFSPEASKNFGAVDFDPPRRLPGIPHESGHIGGRFIPMHKNLLVADLSAFIPIDSPEQRPMETILGGSRENYISPNGNGVNDSLEIPVRVVSPYRILDYRLSIFDQSGEEIYAFAEYSESDIPVFEQEDTPFFRRFVAPRVGRVVPEQFLWDGQTAEDETAPEGRYEYMLEIRDELGRIDRSERHAVIIDVTAPTVEIEVPYTAFSPDGEEQNTLPVFQSGSTEQLWIGEFINRNDEVVRTFVWENSPPADFEWDGKDDQNEFLPDGQYDYRISATDRAGNSTRQTLEEIIINTEDYEIEIEPAISHFSPGTDAGTDKVVFAIRTEAQDIVTSWSIAVRNERRDVVARREGTGTVPPTYVFDGRDETGVVLPQGQYHAEAAAHYEHGKSSYARSAPVILDVTPPRAATRSEYGIFSPDGDRRRDTVSFYNETSVEKEWIIRLEDESGVSVLEERFPEAPPSVYVWDGTDYRSNPVPDGTYTYFLEAVDEAGNRGRSNIITVEIDTRPTPVEITTQYDYFSPTGSGIQDTVTIVPSVAIPVGIDRYILRILDEDEKPVWVQEERGSRPVAIEWDGRDNNWRKVPDGGYTAEIEVFYTKGNHVVERSETVWVDTVPPEAFVESERLYFSPGDPAGQPRLFIAQETSYEDLWEGTIFDDTDRPVRRFTWAGHATDLHWDGRDDQGALIPDGTYRYVLYSRDRAGNITTQSIDRIIVDTRNVTAQASVSEERFAPNNDGFMDNVIFRLDASPSDTASSWLLNIVDLNGQSVGSAEGEFAPPRNLVWDGTTRGRRVPEGRYRGELKVRYLNGKTAQASTRRFLLDVSPPALTLHAGPLPFAPDGEGVRDELVIRPVARDESPIGRWEVAVLDPRGVPFISWNGEGSPPDSIVWDGYSRTGELVQSASDYELVFSASDVLRNRAERRLTVPTDILIIRDGDRLIIQISSITFAPNTPDYVNVSEDLLTQNLRTIDSLAEKLSRYPEYQITVLGHANMVYWYDEQAGRREHEQVLVPLSRARAEAVKTALAERGLSADRMDVLGVGGDEPIVPFSDTVNRWKNRRVEFILHRRD